MIANDISLNKFITYTNSVYDIGGKFKGLERKNLNAYTKPETVAKSIFASMCCGHGSINEFINVNTTNKTSFKQLYKRGEYIPKTHGLRDCIIDTDYTQLEEINNSIILKAKENKVFRNNKVDGLTVMAHDGVELNETIKNIEGLPQREYEEQNEIRDYIKYVCSMNVGPKANIIVTSKQLLEVEKITTKSGKERAKTIGETTAFEEHWEHLEKLIGGVIDVHVFDALYANQYIATLINKANRYFVMRLKDESRDIYKDAKGLFDKRKADIEYEIVERITVKNVKYSKAAKKKDKSKTKTRTEKRPLTNEKLGEKKFISRKTQHKKNSTVETIEYERVITRKEVWSDEFELLGYEPKVRVIRSKETSYTYGRITKQELYVMTNMLNHDVETVLKIMHLRWNIENCGFRKLKQRYNLEHIYIGELNAINYMVQMIFMAFNLLELYMKIRLKEEVDITWDIITRIFEQEFQSNKSIFILLNNSS